MKDNENLIKFGQEIYSKHPALRPFLSFIKKSFFNRPKFSGWGMTSIHEPPWENNNDGKKFLEINDYIKALPTGVKKLHKFKALTPRDTVFTNMKKGAPVHVKSAWIYNDLLKYWNLENSEKIKSSEKIKWVYLKPNTLNVKSNDLNSAKPTESALDFFYPRLVPGGVILFDDYGWDAYEDTKNAIENFFTNKPGILMKLPTGQAIYFHNN